MKQELTATLSFFIAVGGLWKKESDMYVNMVELIVMHFTFSSFNILDHKHC